MDVLGLEFGYRDHGRDIVFLYMGVGRKSMLGLWGPSTTYGRDPHRCHFAITVPLAELLGAGKRLNDLGIPTNNFAGEETSEPSVIGWMPSAQLYFRDPDGHSLEFITLLNDPPDPEFHGVAFGVAGTIEVIRASPSGCTPMEPLEFRSEQEWRNWQTRRT